jgi:predicted transcriptional regulator
MSEETASIAISLRVPTEVTERLDKIAAALERPRSWVMLRALRQYIADEGQEVLDVQEGIAELDRGEGIPIEDVLAEMDEIIAKAEAKRNAG